MSRSKQMLIRQWALIRALNSRPRGLTRTQLAETTGASIATVHRDLLTLEEAGVPIAKERVNGEVRYRLPQDQLFGLTLRADELAALTLARQALGAIEGTRVADELQRLVRRVGATPAAAAGVSFAGHHLPTVRGTLRAIDMAIRNGDRIAFDYRSVRSGQLTRRTVDPVALRVYRAHPYLIAFDCDRADWRIFKIARLEGELSLEGPADPHPEYDEATFVRHSVGIWSGDPVDVAVRLEPSVATRANEYRLVPDQQLQPQPDGSLIVRARVAGLIEVARWVLGWGSAATVLEPPELVDAIKAELLDALAQYQRDPDATPASNPSHDRETTRNTSPGTNQRTMNNRKSR